MTARVLLQGHARLGSWIAIEVRLQNDGPSISGELRLQGGSPGRDAVLDRRPARQPIRQDAGSSTPSRPSFGQQLEVVLVSGDETLARQKVAVTIHDAGQLIVGVVAEQRAGDRRRA